MYLRSPHVGKVIVRTVDNIGELKTQIFCLFYYFFNFVQPIRMGGGTSLIWLDRGLSQDSIEIFLNYLSYIKKKLYQFQCRQVRFTPNLRVSARWPPNLQTHCGISMLLCGMKVRRGFFGMVEIHGYRSMAPIFTSKPQTEHNLMSSLDLKEKEGSSSQTDYSDPSEGFRRTSWMFRRDPRG